MATTVDVETPPAPETPVTPTGGVNRPLANGHGVDGGPVGGGGGAGTSAFRKWQRLDLPQKSVVALQALTCLFSLISAIVMATNKHDDWKEFHNYEEYRSVTIYYNAILLFFLKENNNNNSKRRNSPVR